MPSLTIYSSSRSVFKYAIEVIALHVEWIENILPSKVK